MRHPARDAAIAGQARVERELLAETNGPNTTSELLIFSTLIFLPIRSGNHYLYHSYG